MTWKHFLEIVLVLCLGIALEIITSQTPLFPAVNVCLWIFGIVWLIWFYVRLIKAAKNSELMDMIRRLYMEEERRELIMKLVRN
jgi:lipoprotein signal peptidase